MIFSNLINEMFRTSDNIEFESNDTNNKENMKDEESNQVGYLEFFLLIELLMGSME